MMNWYSSLKYNYQGVGIEGILVYNLLCIGTSYVAINVWMLRSVVYWYSIFKYNFQGVGDRSILAYYLFIMD